MNCVSALSTVRDSDSAIAEVLERAAGQLEGGPAELTLIFASIHHAEALGPLAEKVRIRGIGSTVLGCTGESIVGEDREVEGAPALSLWSIRAPGLELVPRFFPPDDDEHAGILASVRSPLLLLGDPFTFAADRFLKRVNGEKPGLSVFGGMASGAHRPGVNRFVLDGEVFEDGAVAVEIGGAASLLRTVVSQGCRPIGRPLVVTRAESNVIYELGRRPALEVFQEIYEALPLEDQERVQQGLHIGRVINEYQDSFQRGDFLVRNVIGRDDAGGIAITDVVRIGQTVQFHVRDAATADEDLRGLLERERRSRPGTRVAGALLFSCNGRGTRLFPEPNHDVGLIHEVLGPIPAAGFFAMGELGPIGGQNFMHGYTASIVLFEEPSQGSPGLAE